MRNVRFIDRMMENIEKGFVEAIEEGKIVHVSEDYALREGLPIIRRRNMGIGFSEESEKENKKDKSEEYRGRLTFDDFRRPLKKKENKILKDLINNFHWHISKRRREMNLNRKQFAQGIGESEETVKALENGILPKEDFIFINKVQDFLGINLRKDRADFGKSMRSLVDEQMPSGKEKKSSNEMEIGLFGDEIRVIEE